jgi:Collagen triple helix repeat (20 copies)
MARPGRTGIRGRRGPQGVRGQSGVQGRRGTIGKPGLRGLKGLSGPLQTGDVLNVIVKHFEEVYHQLNVQMQWIAKLQHQTDVRKGAVHGHD